MIDELFTLQAARSPDAFAVSFEGGRLTYRELAASVDRLASDLRSRGVGPGSRVGLFLERSLELVVAMLGVLKAGAAYVPLDPSHPNARLAHIVSDAEPGILLTLRGSRSAPPVFPGDRIAVDTNDRSAAPAVGVYSPPPTRSDNDLAYVIYTSGSTGLPKGVAVEHRSVVNVLQSMLVRPGLGAADVLVAITTPMFDISVLEIFLPLICGARVVIATDAAVRDGAALAALIESVGATALQATPSGLRMLIDSGWRGSPELKILCGGEAWSEQLAAELLERCGSLWNMYGPTETTVWSAVAKIEANQPVRIGRPIAETALYVLDKARQLVPVGVTGELYIGGAGLARGYFNRDELTRERFLRDPYARVPGARMYRTGDLVRRHSDGTLEFCGRVDHQVKIRGHRVELGEIEATLRRHPAVSDCAVLLDGTAGGDQSLVAYIVKSGSPRATTHEFREALSQTLPSHMIPSEFVALPALPLTPNGKLDRSQLLHAKSANSPEEASGGERLTLVEVTLANLMARVLGKRRVGREDNFFEIGGHSLLAVRFIAQVNKTFDIKLGVSAIFQRPTVAQLGEEIRRVSIGDYTQGSVVQLERGDLSNRLYFVGAGSLEHKIASLIGPGVDIFGVDIPLPIDDSPVISGTVSGETQTLASVGAMYARAILQHAGSNPCVIAGYSFSGRLAFEAAAEALRLGGRVPTVLLIDAFAWPGMTIGTARQSLRAIMTASGPDVGGVWRPIWRALRRGWELAGLAVWFVRRLPIAVQRRLAVGNHLAGMLDASGNPVDPDKAKTWVHAVVKTFTPDPIAASGVLVRAKLPGEDLLPRHDRSRGWESLFLGSFEIIDAPGDHYSLIQNERNLEIMAGQIRDLLFGRIRSTVEPQARPKKFGLDPRSATQEN